MDDGWRSPRLRFGDATRSTNDALAGLGRVIGGPFVVCMALSLRLEREVLDAILTRRKLNPAGDRLEVGSRDL